MTIGSAHSRRFWEPEPSKAEMLAACDMSVYGMDRAPGQQAELSELKDRLRFEKLIADISSRFVKVPADQIDREIEEAQRSICECLEIDGSGLWQASRENPGSIHLSHIYRNSEIPPRPDRMAGDQSNPWMASEVLAGRIVAVADTTQTPPEASKDRDTWAAYGIQSALALPLAAGGGPVFGVLTFATVHKRQDWPEELKRRLQLIAEIFANALERNRYEQKLRESEARLSLAADSAGTGVWTLDPTSGHIWATEKTYELLGLPPRKEITVRDFMAVVHPDDRETVDYAINDAMQSGQEASFEYRTNAPDGVVRWIAARGRRQTGKSGESDRLMGVCADVTKRKRVEQELAELRERLQAESQYLREEVRVHVRFDEIVGQSKELTRVFRRIEQVAESDSIVLITGETGTGKELVARAIHNHSRRKDRLIVKVDCAALPPTLIESELFGREKGAYTGALTRQVGRFELANGSTLLLDEIGELPLELQCKLLRVVQEGQFERLGSPRPISVDVRLIAATHRDLRAKVKDGSFREDLYYRLNVFPIQLPPLRERSDDIPALVWTFVRELERKMGKKIEYISKETMEKLQRYTWPGNIRELRNSVERALILSEGRQLSFQLPEIISATPSTTLKDAEYQHILSVLEKTRWRIKGPGGAAELLDMHPSTLFSTIRRLHIPTKSEKV